MPVIVVGAGHNGLVCAARLASAGVAVTVLESASHAGGGVWSDARTLPGFVHDSCSGFFPMTLASPAFDGLDVRERVSWVNPSVAMAHPFLDGTAIVLDRSLDATVESLEAAAPGAGRGWRDVMGPVLARHDRAMRAALTDSFPPVRDGLALALGLRLRGIRLARLVVGSTATFGRRVFGHDRPTAWFTGSALHADVTPGSAGGAALAFGLKLVGHSVGWGFPRGGARALTDVLVQRVEELGGTVRCDAAVESVTLAGGRVKSVRLRDGEELQASAVVLALSVGPAVAMLPPGALPGRLSRRLDKWRYGLGTLKLDYALAGPVPWTSAQARGAAVVHVGDELPALFRSTEEAGAGRMPAEPMLVVGQHSLHDVSRAPAGQHTLYAYARVPQRLDIEPEEAADRVDRRIEQFAPGFRDLVLARAVRTPADIERDNPSMVGGDLAGGSCEADQQLFFRPSPSLFRGRTPIRALYFAGSSNHPGPGVHGVAGAAAARAVLADRGRRASFVSVPR